MEIEIAKPVDEVDGTVHDTDIEVATPMTEGSGKGPEYERNILALSWDTFKPQEKGAKLAKSLHGRHIQMIAIGGAIGSGLFVGSGSALASGGPGNLIFGR